MKAFTAVVATLAATASASAEPWWGYGGYGLIGSPCVNGYGLPVPCAGKKKREAEAEPWLGYGYGLGAWGWGLKSAPCVNAANVPVPCRLLKREAEAEPWLGYGYGLGAWGLGLKSAPCVNALNIPVPCAGKKKRDADAGLIYGAGVPALGYGGYGLGLGYGLAAPVILKSDCKNAWGLDVPCAQETPAEEAAPAEVEKRSADADAQLYLSAGWPWGPLVHSSNLGICTNVAGDQVPC